MRRARQRLAKLAATDRELGKSATAVIVALARSLPPVGRPRLVHGSLYTRHVLDLGEAAGLIDWDHFGQGPAELDAGVFLATTWRMGCLNPALAGDARRAERAFRRGTAGLFDERALAWHRAAVLLRVAGKLARRKADLAGAGALLDEAVRLAGVAKTGRGAARGESRRSTPVGKPATTLRAREHATRG